MRVSIKDIITIEASAHLVQDFRLRFGPLGVRRRPTPAEILHHLLPPFSTCSRLFQPCSGHFLAAILFSRNFLGIFSCFWLLYKSTRPGVHNIDQSPRL